MRLLTMTCLIAAASTASITAIADDDTIKARERIEVETTPEAAWEKFGDFCAIADWHPAVATCEISESDGNTYRTLTLADGGTIKEKHLGAGKVDTSYSYEIVEGPLPVKNYTAVFEIKEDDDGAGIKWTAQFEADGAEPKEAKKIIEGIFESGLDAIEKMY